MRYFWTRFLPSHPKTLVYMLQSSEYKTKDYSAWLRRTDDFRTVTKRQKLDYTKKAKLLLIGAWKAVILTYAIVVGLLFLFSITDNALYVVSAAIVFVLSPFVVEYGIMLPLWVGKKLIQEPKQQKMAASARQILANHKGLKIAIAGSYGKTTAKEILRTVLGEGKKVASTPGNMNTLIGISRFAQTLDGSEEIVIFELGEEKVGDVRELCDLVRPDVGVITGISEAHLTSFGTIEKTVETIFELQDYLGDKPIYKNKESPLVAAKISNDDNLSFTREGTNGWQVSNPQTSIHGTTFTISKGKESIEAHTGLLGNHNIGIIGVAVSIADSVGINAADIKAGIKKTVPFEHRMQPRNLHGAWVIDDTYNGNSQGVQAGLKLLKSLEAKRRIYVTPGLVEQGDKTREIHTDIGKHIAQVADVVVLMQNSVTDFISDGLREANFDGKLIVVEDPLEFYTNLDQFVAGGDVVLMQNDWTDNYA